MKQTYGALKQDCRGVNNKNHAAEGWDLEFVFQTPKKVFSNTTKNYLSKIISCAFLLYSPVIGLDLESHSHSREKVQFFETRLRFIFLALTQRDEIEIIIWPFSYFETRTRLDIATLMFRDEIETSENHFSWSSEKKWSWLSSRIPGIENSRWPLVHSKASYGPEKKITMLQLTWDLSKKNLRDRISGPKNFTQ